MKLLVTGGAGFIGSAVIRQAVLARRLSVVNLDKLTYAADPAALEGAAEHPGYAFEQVDIADAEAVAAAFQRHAPDAVMHLAAETHVDRSIDGPMAFVRTNLVGTAVLLQAALAYWRGLPPEKAARFRFHHVSTDEVFGSLGPTGYFTETTRYQPNSPYSASKAGADHLVRAWHETYRLPMVMSNCSNNYGPYQFPEKLIPLVITRALEGRSIPVYGKGENVRDWLFVEDHADALLLIVASGALGESYNVGGLCEMKNIDVVRAICALLDEQRPRAGGGSYADLIEFVTDRPGHDQRYAMDIAKIERTLGWRPRETFASGLRRTVGWYLANRAWCERAAARYQGERLGLSR